ncbi:hydroxyproline-rich glycoprotein family protein [Arabidopsis thaliana]|nr:hydroxyproline-rich glycoprotein family protein [Arabidopsis thaliana]ANM64318.1 hydroxyproline-rich glycoprotein family protein [Arabidopsis thaliana]|eukprot:NP_001326357.1 hydroxyproline-rich glycoprotein family protein [Arabidopsis thaliana]
MICLLKIESPTPGWKKSLEKLLKTINDVSFMIDKQSKTVYLSGKVDPQIILEKITKAGKKAVILWSNNGQSKQPENRKDHLMEQRYASGHINVPDGFSNYHPPYMNGPNGFSNYHLPDYWMNQPQLYNPTICPPPPPPYPRQVHPQPPAPPPYKFHQKEPVAKSFPPTPAPPKNFTMGDLQLCRIM